MNDENSKEARLNRRLRRNQKSLLREKSDTDDDTIVYQETSSAEQALLGIKKTTYWFGIVVGPIYIIITVFNAIISKVQEIIAEQNQVQESKIQRIEHDIEKLDDRTRELEKK